jgi:Protein of unknown function (DUF2752)
VTALGRKANRKISQLWLSTPMLSASWAGLLLAGITLPHGSGITICCMQSATGIPCPGCGLTRSMSCGLRGLFAQSWDYHPFGVPILLLFICACALSLAPATRKKFEHLIDSHPALFKNTYQVFVVAFVGFGVIRAFTHLLTGVASGLCRATLSNFLQHWR